MSLSQKKKIIGIVVLVISAFLAEQKVFSGGKEVNSDSRIEQLVKSRVSGKMVTIEAIVIKLLKDDLKGDKHQKMILKNANNTLLLAHNIDIAQRVPAKKGDVLLIKGQYEWNDKGGLLHWTHRSNSSHPAGWIKHNNITYQ